MEEQELKQHVNQILADHDELFLVDVKVKGTYGNQKVLVFIDGDEGISIDQCSQISRKLGSVIEETDLFEGKYTLEVSSPGVDFPLTLRRQYVKNIGREVAIDLDSGEFLEGKLEKVGEDSLEILSKKDVIRVPFASMKQIKVKVSFK